MMVKDSFAGKTGLCPKCKARVEVPEPAQGELSEDLIMNILGPGLADPAEEHSTVREPERAESSAAKNEKSSPPKKSCHKCNRTIMAGIHICPHCHTYIAELTDFRGA